MITIRKLHYLYASDGLFAIYVMNGENDTMYYVSKDYLGSFDMVTDERGNVLERYSFDPWGRRRNPTEWTFTDVPTPHLFDRGYTGHEHLDKFGLINMNGRVYDPWLGRFLSADPFVQTPTYSQSYNRYSYCLNNPLKYVDPSGYKMLSLQEIIGNLWDSPFGGTWTSSSGYHYFGSFNEGLDAGIAYQNEHSSWSGTIGGNENGTRQLYSFFNSTPYNPNIIRGVIFDQYWADYNKTTGKFYYCHTMDEVDIYSIFPKNEDEISIWEILVLAWDLRIIGTNFPDLISLDITLNSTPVIGESMTYSLNLFTRGERGINITASDQKRYGPEIDWGVNLNFGFYQGDPVDINQSSILGPVQSISVGWIYSAQGYFGYDEAGKIVWVGYGSGIGLSYGGSYGIGRSHIIWNP